MDEKDDGISDIGRIDTDDILKAFQEKFDEIAKSLNESLKAMLSAVPPKTE